MRIHRATEGSGAYLGMVSVLAGGEDALAGEGEAGASVHLPFEELGAGVEALDEAGAPGEGEAVGDGVVVEADAGGEGGELGLGGVAVVYGGEPGVEGVPAFAAGEDLGECGDVGVECGQVGAAGGEGGQGCGLVAAELALGRGDPSGDLAGRGRGGRLRRGGEPERGEVAADGVVAAVVAAGGDGGVQGGDAGVPGGPLGAQPGLPPVQARGGAEPAQ